MGPLDYKVKAPPLRQVVVRSVSRLLGYAFRLYTSTEYRVFMNGKPILVLRCAPYPRGL